MKFYRWRSLSRESILFLASLGALSMVYGVWQYFYVRQSFLKTSVVDVEQQIKKTHGQLVTLNKTAKTMRSTFWKYSKKTMSRQDLGEILKTLAKQHHFFQMQFSFMPEKIFYKDATFSVKKTMVQLQFAAGFDGHIWEFMKELFCYFPGIIHSKELKLDKELLEAQEAKFLGADALIRGIYKFEWYTFSSFGSQAR